MQIAPDAEAFARGLAAGDNQVVWTRRVADLDTPVSLMLRLTNAGRDAFLLESVTGGANRGRYSVIGMKPDLVWRCEGETAAINRQARSDAAAFEAQDAPALASLRAVLAESRIDLPEDLPPMAAGLFGYLGYDMIRLVEHLPDIPEDKLDLPDALMLRPTVIVIIDHAKSEITLVTPVWAADESDPRAAYARARERLADALGDLDRPIPEDLRETGGAASREDAVSNMTEAEYHAAVNTARDYIAAGDIFQVVLSHRWAMPFDLPPFALYRALRRSNPSPYMFFFNFGGFQIVGASPEILVRVRDGTVTVRPIAGTRPRGATQAEDKALEADLLGDAKEVAEHLMLLDLGRNDAGRVSKIGTVTPTEQFIVERYSHVMHIVSNVEGQLAEGHDALSALLAGLPAGTVSGAPKVRAMEIIDELEVEKRGVYAGGVGYFSSAGEMDICIALRTGVIRDETLYVQAGGGVVWDSTPEGEYQETINKAGALMAAAEEAARFVKFRGQ